MSDGQPGRTAGGFFADGRVRAAGVLGACLVAASLIHAVGHRSYGRYQLGGNPGHLCVIDTDTGQVWEKFAPDHGGETYGKWKAPK